MPDPLVAIVLRLYPEEFRDRFGPQIEADLYHPDTNRLTAMLDILGSALRLRATSPGSYIWLTAGLLAAVVVTFAGSITIGSANRIINPRLDAATQLYALLFFAVLLVVLSVLLLAVSWLQTYRKMAAKCSKSKT
ncbi:MAG TPA: hypothetical protein VFQ91_21255 [Bryobacteraceae bacterium]|nr:hypothetical protein [Bryobacteraceae bacterium]